MKKLSVLSMIMLLCAVLSISAFAKSDVYQGYSETENASLAISDITATADGNIIKTEFTKGNNYLFLPSSFNAAAMWLNFKTAAEEVWTYSDGEYLTDIKNAKSFNLKNNAVYDSETGAYALTLRAVSSDSENLSLEYSQYVLYVMKSENVGAMFISFDDPAYGRLWVDSSPNHTNDSAEFTKVNMCMLNEKGGEVYNNSLTQFKGRGNTTWGVDAKKPYQIKLNKKTDLLESGNSSNKNKTWVLIANSLDMTLFRNAMALDLAQYLGLKESPEYKFVDLYFDGIYRGSYLLCEKVQINSGRVEIKDSEDFTSATDKTATAQCKNSFGLTVQYNPTATATEAPENGGYLLEQDIVNYALNENSWFINPGGSYVVIKSPECATKEQALYISELYSKMWYATQKGNYDGLDVSEYIDIDSLSSICLLNEYLLNINYITSSSYFYLPEKGNENYEYKFYAGPAWDFDGSMGARCDIDTFLNPAYMRWYGSWYFGTEKVKRAIQEKALDLYELKDVIFSVTPKIDSETGIKSMSYYKELVSGTQKLNYKVNNLAQFVLYKNFASYDEGYDYTYNFMTKRHELVLNSIITPEIRCAKHGHVMPEVPTVNTLTCTEDGYMSYTCAVCGYEERSDVITATGHRFNNGVCEVCSTKCSCNCHKSGFMGFIWKLQRFFYKLFGTNKVCECGMKHF